MVSHSLNLFWFADVYPTVSHKNCPKKKKKLGTRVLEESLFSITAFLSKRLTHTGNS